MIIIYVWPQKSTHRMLNSYAAAKLQHGRTKVPPPPRRGAGRGRGTVLTWNDNYKSKYKMENV